MYPPARRLDLREDLFGHQVADPYRWLEDDGSPESAAWLAAQDELWGRRRDALPLRERFASRVAELLNVGSVSAPAWRGTSRFFTRRDPGQEHAVLYVRQPGGPAGDERALVDPMAVDPTGRTTLDAWQPDTEGRLLAYQLSQGGTEESALRVIDVATGALADGPIDRTRYTSVAWLPGGKAFYYVRRLPPGEVPDGEEQYHRRVYLHVVGTDPGDDALVFGEGRDKTAYYSASVSRDGRWLVISSSLGTAPRDDIWIADLAGGDPAAPALAEVMVGRDAQAALWPRHDGRLYARTDLDAPRGRLVVADPARPQPEHWRDLLPQDGEAVLRDYAILDGPQVARPVLLASWTRHAISEVTVHDLASGARRAALELPGVGSVGGLVERPEAGHEAWFCYADYATPAQVMRYDGRTGELTVDAAPPGAAARPAIRATQHACTSRDGTTVRLVLLTADGAGDAPGARPTILNGYGGFNIAMTPGYSPAAVAWAEAGGAYAVAQLRGGSEEGEEWHRAGMLGQRQNVFDDFHAAAEHLIAAGVTTAGQLAAWGGSNGGLLVGAAITQRPELFAAAVCSAPLLDMVRYEKFGLGETWNSEYGTAADPRQLEWLLSYSPYHRIRAGTAYPAVLFTVFTNDTRVVPLHAYKMCAALQHATSSPRPVLLRAEGQVGHGARAASLSAALAGDCLAFVAAETGL